MFTLKYATTENIVYLQMIKNIRLNTLFKQTSRKMNNPKEYNLFDLYDLYGYDGWYDVSSLGSLFYQITRRLPSMQKVNFLVKRSFKEELCELYRDNPDFDCLEHIYCNRFENEQPDDDEDEEIKEKYEYILICRKDLMVSYFEECVRIAYTSHTPPEEIERVRQVCRKHRKENEDELNNLFIVIFEYGHFKLEKSKVREAPLDLSLHYNDDFLPVSATIDRFLAEERSGLIILHGKQGTGKTTYIRHLINTGQRKMIYMGGDLIDKLSDPAFVTFIRQQKNSVLIVEDCEELLASRNGSTRTNTGLINILNISDGLLGDDLCIKFICTFNAPLKDIDQALLRKGRLAARYEFKELAPEKVNRLIQAEKLDLPEQTQPMTLAEIYNYHDADFSLQRKKAGF